MHATATPAAGPTRPDPGHLARRIREMIAGGRVHAARPLLGALRRMAPPSAEISDIAGLLLLREGRIPEALAELDAGLALDSTSVALHISRADARMQAQDVLGAAADAAEAVILAPGNAQAKAVLGVVLLEMNRPEDALPCLREAVAAEPRRPAWVRALAAALEQNGDAAGAAAVLDAAIAQCPGDVALRTAAMMTAMRRRDFTAAAELAEAARRQGVADACVFGLHGHALSSLGRHDAASEAYAEALKLAPEDPYVRHLVVSAGLLPQASRAPAPYLETVFDGYAGRFESHLIGLQYRVPGLLRAAVLDRFPALAEAGDAALGPVLDLGCGTGLMAVALSDLKLDRLVGVDISAGMLAEAQDKGLYHSLVHAELEAFLARDTTTWPLILAADVFCYFGVLDDVLPLVHARLPPGGVLMFTVEECDGAQGGAQGGAQDGAQDGAKDGAHQDAGGRGWRLGRQGRFAHDADYVARAAIAAGFAVRTVRREVLRTEAQANVPGLLFVLERVRHDG
ncbi:MAG: methyltransferase domain-containing protein [Acetobacteraceae bacterium]|nr:methyltransferase domain-containing protein [Acetobacteraceae bacterium]